MRFVLPLAMVLLALTSPARAHDIEYGTGAICDTQNRAEHLAMLAGSEDPAAATAAVNAEAGSAEACAVETVAFVRGAVLGTTRSKDETFDVVEILVVGVGDGDGLRTVEPKVYFMLAKIDERVA